MIVTRVIMTMLMVLLTAIVDAQDWREEAKDFLKAQSKEPDALAMLSGSYSDLDLMLRVAFSIDDSSYSARSAAVQVVYNIGIHSTDSLVRQACVNLILKPLALKDDEISGMLPALLRTFRRRDFDGQARTTLRNLTLKAAANGGELIKLAGFLRLHDLSPKLREYSLPGHAQGIRWAALLALARMGDEAATAEVMQRARKLPVNDEVVYRIFPDLVFTRQQRAISYLIQLLNSDDEGCRSADAEHDTPMPCAYRILEQVTPLIAGLPLSVSAHGDLETDDYPAALKMARAWFAQNPNYGIIDDKY